MADIVVPLSYAGEMNAQLRRDIRNYKDGWSDDVKGDALYRLSALTWHFFYHHSRCLEAIGGPVSHMTLVPSGRPDRRPEGHPLQILASYAPASWNRLEVTRTAEARERVIDTRSLEIQPPIELRGAHVVVFDDTFTTGAKAQSVAAIVRDAGARFVSIVVIARVLNQAWGPTAELLERHPRTPWDGAKCPITGSACPI
ncbi:MAG: phosphoribosyltransferase [Microbacterium sp.]|nr:phosphoribosyltransferase [Microbacterium sp.]